MRTSSAVSIRSCTKGWNPEFGGSYKYQQNYIKSKDVDGNESIVFTPPSAKTRALMGNLLYQFNLEAGKPTTNRLVLVFDFILASFAFTPFRTGTAVSHDCSPLSYC